MGNNFKNPVLSVLEKPAKVELTDETLVAIGYLKGLVKVAGLAKDLVDKTESGEFSESDFVMCLAILHEELQKQERKLGDDNE